MKIANINEWESEPDYMDGVFFGLPCFIRRHEHYKTLNGYVGVDNSNSFFETEYGDLDVDVHGGLTFASGGTHGVFGYRWWFGFDCGHAFDLQPGLLEYHNSHGFEVSKEVQRIFCEGTYRNMSYVQDQCIELAYQLSKTSDYINIEFEAKPDPQLLRLVNDQPK